MRPCTSARPCAMASSGWSDAWPSVARVRVSVKRSIRASMARNLASMPVASRAFFAIAKASSVALSYSGWSAAGSRAWSAPVVARSMATGSAARSSVNDWQNPEAAADLEDGEDRAFRERTARELERGRPGVLRPLRSELIEYERHDAHETLAGGGSRRTPDGWTRGDAWRACRSLRLHQTERFDRAGFAVLEHLDLVRAQVFDQPAGPISDDQVQADEIAPRGEDGRGRGILGTPGRRQRRQEKKGHARRVQPHARRVPFAGCDRPRVPDTEARFVPVLAPLRLGGRRAATRAGDPAG